MHRPRTDRQTAPTARKGTRAPAGEEAAGSSPGAGAALPGAPGATELHENGAPPKAGRGLWQTDAGLLFAVVVWGLNFPILKAALGVMHPHVINAFRFAVSAVVLGALYAARQHRAGQPLLEPLRRYGRQILMLGLLGYVFYQLSFIVGINNTLAGSAALIMAGSPIWTATIGHLFGLERLSRAAWLGLVLSLAGTTVVVLAGSQEIGFGSEMFLGNVLMLAAAAMWGAYTALSRPVLQHLSPSALTFFSLLVALPILWGLAVPYYDEVVWARVDLWVWAAIIYSGGLSTGLTVVIWNMAIKRVGASQTAVYSNLVPFVAVLASVFLIREAVTAGQIAGGVLILGGLAVMQHVRRRASAVPR